MDALLKGQAEMAAGDIKSSEETSEKVVAEVLPKEKTVEEELLVQEPGIVVEAVVADSLKDASEDIQEDILEEIIENIPVGDTTQKGSVVPSVTMTPVVMAPAAPKPKKQINYEKFIGENLFGKLGILIFVIGVGFFVKYAIDKNWINETFRTVLWFPDGGSTTVCCRTFTEEISYIQFIACWWCFCCVLSYSCYCVPLLSYLFADCGVYHSDSYYCIYVCSLCDI